jgi:hypothetical protein
VDLFGRQELENPHGPFATGTAPNRRFSCVRHVRWRHNLQQSAAEGQKLTAAPIRQQAEVADARESPWEDMLQEAAQEGLVSQCHHSLLVVMSVVLPAEGDLGVSEIDESAVVEMARIISIGSCRIWSMYWLFSLRLVQGLCNGLTVPLLMTTALRVLGPPVRLYGLACYALTATFVPNISDIVAALWTDCVDWHFIFLQ